MSKQKTKHGFDRSMINSFRRDIVSAWTIVRIGLSEAVAIPGGVVVPCNHCGRLHCGNITLGFDGICPLSARCTCGRKVVVDVEYEFDLPFRIGGDQ